MASKDPPEALGAVRVLLSEGPLGRREVPLGFDRRPADQFLREPFAACTLRATRLFQVAAPSSPAVARIVSADKRAAYETQVYVAFSSEHQLLGFGEETYDSPPERSQLLFRCTSDDEAGMEWGDVQDLCFYIPTIDLRPRLFERDGHRRRVTGPVVVPPFRREVTLHPEPRSVFCMHRCCWTCESSTNAMAAVSSTRKERVPVLVSAPTRHRQALELTT
jgi:hypothetical protein